MQIKSRAMLIAVTTALAAFATPTAAAPDAKAAPYYASIAPTSARMRTGPGRTYPASWLYQRAGLPVRVLDSYDRGAWLKIEDPGGTQGWMLGKMISARRTGVVTGAIVELRDEPAAGGRVLWRAEPGVVGRISKCSSGWCWFDVRGQGGYVETNRIWGVDAGESLN